MTRADYNVAYAQLWRKEREAWIAYKTAQAKAATAAAKAAKAEVACRDACDKSHLAASEAAYLTARVQYHLADASELLAAAAEDAANKRSSALFELWSQAAKALRELRNPSDSEGTP